MTLPNETERRANWRWQIIRDGWPTMNGSLRASAKRGFRTDGQLPILADIVAKVPKGAAVDFSPKNETSDNRRSMALQTRYQSVSLALGDVVPHIIIQSLHLRVRE